MTFVLRNLQLTPDQDESSLPSIVTGLFNLPPTALTAFQILRKGVDARKKPRVLLVYTVSFCVADPESFWKRHHDTANLEQLPDATPQTFIKRSSHEPIIIVGMGPAGLFCALRLAAHGLPTTILERGKPVEERVADVARFWREGLLDPESNVQFGEGGAGTFSDGKLTCRLRDPNTAWILDQLIRFGAPTEIRYQAKPHVGTDRLRTVVSTIRADLLQQGCDIRFSTKLSSIVHSNGQISTAISSDNLELPCRHLVLAIGHSARDTYATLAGQRLVMEPKPFAIGLRVEHPQSLIDKIQYGQPHPALPKADYALTYNNEATGRSCYSFCMCPGGVIIASSSEKGMLVANGMSNLGRDSGLANSALVVNVRPDDFNGNDPLAGVRFQQLWEQLAFEAGGRSYNAPAQNLMAFIKQGKGAFCSSYRPGTTETELSTVLPDYVTSTLKEGILSFGRKMKGFITSEATLTGIETRTSAPLRILRGENCQSPTIQGLYPCGEGAGYAGGIMSAALDGVRVADRIAEQMQ
jgi:uncharacterized FAD-dependent dehydrogenase